MNDITKPQLTETGIKYLLSNTLKNCFTIQHKYYNNLLNIILFLIFAIGLFLFLKSKYKGKQNEYEIRKKNLQKKEYILSCIQKMNTSNNVKLKNDREKHSLITSLPLWN